MTEVRSDGPWMVRLSEPLGRSARLGPFPSARDAIKFGAYAGIGALVATLTVPIAWLPFLGTGFLFAVARKEGRGLDSALVGYLEFRLRQHRHPPETVRRRPPGSTGSVLRVEDGRLLAIVRTGGIPVAFLPPVDARGLFDGFRVLLRSLDGPLTLVADSEPMSAERTAPTREDCPEPERSAREGYRVMLALVVRRRRRRVVHLILRSEGGPPGSLLRLEEQLQTLSGRLLALGLSPIRLHGRELAQAAERIGWGSP